MLNPAADLRSSRLTLHGQSRYRLPKVLLGMGLVGLFGVALGQVEEKPPLNRQDSEETSQADEKPTDQAPGPNISVIVEETLPMIAGVSSVAAKQSNSLLQTPAGVSVVSHPLFRSQDAVVLSDALKNVSGINLQSNFGVHDYFLIRGFDSLSSGLVLTDGALEPEAAYYHLYNLEQVEVLKGPGAFLYGGNPLSGTVSLVRKQPQFSTFFQGAATLGSFETFRGRFDLNLGRDDSPVAFRLNLMGQDAAGYRDYRDNRQVAVNPALAWRLGEHSRLDLNFEWVENRYGPDAGLPLLGDEIAPVSRRQSYGSHFDSSDQEIFRLRLDWSTRFSDRVTLRNKFFLTDFNWISAGTLLNGVFPDESGTLQVQRVLNQLDDRQVLLGNQVEGVFDFVTAGVQHRLLAGIEVSRLSDDFSLEVSGLLPLDLFNPQRLPDEPAFPLSYLGQQGDTRSLVVAPYVVDQLSLGKKTKLMLGARIDRVDFEDSFSGAQEAYAQLSPMAGFLVSPRPEYSLYVNAGSGFSPPSTLVAGDRRPEESVQYEGGFKGQFLQGRLNANFSLYHLERQNVAIPDDTGVTRRIGDQLSRGLEAEISAQHNSFWHSFFSYAYNRSRLTRFAETGIVNFFPLTFGTIDRSGNRAPFAPRHILSLWSTREFRGRFGLGGGARYVSGQFIAADNLFAIDPFLVFDAVLSYRHENWRISFNIKNIGGTSYETRGFGANSVIPADPTAFFGTIQFTR